MSEFAAILPAIPPPTIAAIAPTASAIFVDRANPIETPAALATPVAAFAADTPATFTALIAKYCVIIFLCI